MNACKITDVFGNDYYLELSGDRLTLTSKGGVPSALSNVMDDAPLFSLHARYHFTDKENFISLVKKYTRNQVSEVKFR